MTERLMRMGAAQAMADQARSLRQPRAHRHSTWTIALHWSSVLAIVIAAASALSHEWVEEPALRTVLMQVHRQAGNFVLLVLGLRLAVRFGTGMANHAGDMHVLLRAAAQVAHVALYALLVALPALGLAASNAHGVVVWLFGLVPLPLLSRADPDLADTLTDFHLWAAWALLLLVSAHVAAAMWHHLVRRDGVLAAMFPLVKGRSDTH